MQQCVNNNYHPLQLGYKNKLLREKLTIIATNSPLYISHILPLKKKIEIVRENSYSF